MCVCFLEHCCLQVVFQVCPSHVLRTLSSPKLGSFGYIRYIYIYIYIYIICIYVMIIVSAIPYIEEWIFIMTIDGRICG